jgi:hypothetical protein
MIRVPAHPGPAGLRPPPWVRDVRPPPWVCGRRPAAAVGVRPFLSAVYLPNTAQGAIGVREWAPDALNE